MNDSDGSHSCLDMTQELTQAENDDPDPRRLCLAADDVNGRRSIRA